MSRREPILTSPRLRFDLWQADDFDDLYTLHADPRVQPSYAPDPTKWTRDAIAERLRGYMDEQATLGFTKWRLALSDGAFIGRAGWSPWGDATLEIGYALMPHHWGGGYASEAAQALVDWGVANRPGDTLVGFALSHNHASQHILQKIGMRYIDHRIIGGVENAYFALPRPAYP